MSELPDEPVVERSYTGAFVADDRGGAAGVDRRADLELHAFDAADEVGGSAGGRAGAE